MFREDGDRAGAGAAGTELECSGAGEFADGGERPTGRLGGGHGRRSEGAGESERLGEPFPYADQLGRPARGGRGRQMAGGGQVHVVVEEFDDGDGARAHALGRVLAFALEPSPGFEHGAAHRLPVEPVAPT